MQRPPAVAGQFYPGGSGQLRSILSELIPAEAQKIAALGVMAPHAGYIYSGAIAGRTLAGVRIPEKVIVLGPNHHGAGHPAAVYASGSWVTPLGESAVDAGLAERILAACPAMAADTAAHRFEHSLEVQLPFLQVLAPETRIVPICLRYNSLEKLLEMGEGLARAISEEKDDVLLLASTDMSHYESGDIARSKDEQALRHILDLDPPGLYDEVQREKISMCGVVPVVVMLETAKRLGASSATLIEYGNSGDITGNQSEVVGYAGVVVS
jgi:MEMO1 family protein